MTFRIKYTGLGPQDRDLLWNLMGGIQLPDMFLFCLHKEYVLHFSIKLSMFTTENI